MPGAALVDQVYNDTDSTQPVGTNPNPSVATRAKETFVKKLNYPHPEYKMLRSTWYKLGLLYAGGWALFNEAELLLVRRPKELSDVYQARLSKFTYENHLGTALDWYASELFEEDPHIEPTMMDDGTGKRDVTKLNAKQTKFYDQFLLDCDRAGTSFVDLFRKAFQNLLLYGKTYVVMDLPATAPGDFANLEDQKTSGALNPYLCVYSPLEAINWELDTYGNLNWIIFAVNFHRGNPQEEQQVINRWYYYDRTEFQVWEYAHSEEEKNPPNEAKAQLVAQGRHMLASRNVVPVSLLQVPDGLWLANRAMLAAQSHLNTDNVLDWALFLAALAMPVITSDADIQPTLSEAGFIKLPGDSKFEWTEPQGTSFRHLADRLGELTENIFRSFYLIHQGRSGRATPSAQSGVSKQMDMMPSRDILKMFGDLLRAFMQRVLNRVSQSMPGDTDLQWDIRGFEFKDDISDAEVQTIADALLLKVPSETFEKEAYKRIARALTPDANPSVHRKMFEEIDAAEDMQTRQLKEDQAQLTMRAKVLAANTPEGQGPQGIKSAVGSIPGPGSKGNRKPDDGKNQTMDDSADG